MAEIDNIYIAIRDKLIGNAAVSALVGNRVYHLDRTSKTDAYPRINFGLMREFEPTQSGNINRQWWTFKFFAENRDTPTCQQISRAVEDMLHYGVSIAPTGWEGFNLYKLGSASLRPEGDSNIAQVVDDYMFLIRPA